MQIAPKTTAAMEIIDQRGRHWELKEKPKTWEFTKFWADKQREIEQNIRQLDTATKANVQLPWTQNSAHHLVGNQAKCIWMQMYLYEQEKVIEIQWADEIEENTNFYRIKDFTVLIPARFNSGLFPLPSGWRERDGITCHCPFQYKTLIKNWQAVGMVEVSDGLSNGMRFNEKYWKRIKEQRSMTEVKRKDKKERERMFFKPYAKKQPVIPFTFLPTPFVTAPFTSTPTPLVTAEDSTTTLAPIIPTIASAALPVLPSALELLLRIACEQAAITTALEAVQRAQADVDAATAVLQAAQARLDSARCNGV
jgi:hypothetical protein